ncbi:MAG: SulP family inorganic anion transporter [Burkholderiaceae bacterium]
MSSLARWLPFMAWWPDLRQPGTVRTDLMAGLTGAIVVLPQGVAFATIAGMPPQYGLYSAMIPCIIAALLGSSRQLVTGPANAISLTVAALIAPLAATGSDDYVRLVLTLSFMVGIWQVLVGLSGLGKLIAKVPHAVIVGFTSGAAILIANSQVRHFFGFDWPRGMSVIETASRFIPDLGSLNPPAFIAALATLVACFVARKVGTGWIPYMLVGVIVGGLVAQGMVLLMGPGWALKAVDKLPGAIPPLSSPDFSLETFRILLVPSLIMTLLALAEAMSIASAVALRRNQRLNGTQEIIAQGTANIFGSFFSAYPASGSFNRSAVNVEAGARTPLAATTAGVLLIVLVAFVGPLFAYLPMAAVAGILFMVAWTLIDVGFLRRAFGLRHWADVAGWSTTFILTLTASLEVAIVVGIIVHLIVARITGDGGEH